MIWLKGGASFDLTSIAGGGLIYWNATKNVIHGLVLASDATGSDYLIGTSYNGKNYQFLGNVPVKIDGVWDYHNLENFWNFTNISKRGTSGYLMSPGTIHLNTTDKTLTVTDTTDVNKVIVEYGGKVSFNPKIDLSGYASDAPGIFYLDTSDLTIKFKTLANGTPPEEAVIIGFIWAWKLSPQIQLFTKSPVKIDDYDYDRLSETQQYGEKIIAIGDSITMGYTGQKSDGTHVHTAYPWTYWAAKTLGVPIENQGLDGAKITKSADLTIQTALSTADLTQYTQVILFAGVNDYLAGLDIDTMVTDLEAELTEIFTANPSAYIYGILPMQTYYQNIGMTTANADGHTLAEYMDKIKQVYISHEIPVLDWRDGPLVTSTGWKTQTQEGIHPTERTYQLLGSRIA
ncbi:GDSL-type esterase/lipase family protein, partial [Lactiplantibacillus mudanjiangensis]|uniref:GDSL-type esterase/lipase family protein n=1 Tax=Lactiplantibacillus mudanjiangensis TaxID=1296538 RepID=UPI00103046CD